MFYGYGILNNHVPTLKATAMGANGGSSYDADALAFITAASITDSVQKNAINTLVTDLKTYGIWSKMKVIYPMVGGTAFSHKFNLKDPRDLDVAFRLQFVNGWLHSSTGAKANGIDGYADTKFTPSTSWSTSNAHSSYYSRTNISLTSNQILFDAFIDADSNYQLFLGTNGLIAHSSFNSSNGTAVADISSWGSRTDGFFIGNRANINSNKIYRNSTLVGNNTGTGGGTMPNIPLFLAAANTPGGAVVFSKLENSFATIGEGMTDTESSNLYTSIQQFQVTLGRAV